MFPVYSYVAIRAFLLQTLVVLLSVSGHVVEDRPSLGHQWFFFMVDILLVSLWLILLQG